MWTDCWKVQNLWWRNFSLWQYRNRGSVLLSLPADSSCEDGICSCFNTQQREISIWFYLTSVCDCGMHFSMACHTELRVLTLLFLNPVMTSLSFLGPQIFSLCEIPLWVWYFDLESRQNSQWLQWEFVRRAWRAGSAPRPPFVSIPSHVGWRQSHKPQRQTGTFTEVGMFGIYFEWSLIISNVLHDVLPKSQRQTPSKIPQLAEDVTLLK